MSNESSALKFFLITELKKVRKTRNVIVGIFLTMFALCYGFFLSAFFQRWLGSEDRFTFFYKSLPTLSFLFIYLGFVFGLLSWVVYRKNQKFIRALQHLNIDDLAIYEQYTKRMNRIFSAIAPYVFFKNELLFFPLIGNKRIEINQIHRIETKIIRNYRGPNSYRVYFYNEFNKIHQVTMNQKGAFDFLQEQLREKNPNLVVVARND